ncbi:PadR family transcriptional regulator [Pseudonocardia sp. CA-107938]|uniref:PadR family transcriptional regulator n=1 Tax=Pseudonocardia sp. CA-107938 TaxID=3240021 RepID=UPI003D8F5431
MSLPHALLGLLIVQPRSGYELTKEFEGHLGRHAWAAGHTSIYPELNRMADAGLVEVTHEGARGSRYYAATDAGRAELRRWMFERDRTRKVRNEEVLRMFLISALEPEDAIAYLRGVAEFTGDQAAQLAEVIATLEAQCGPIEFGALAAEYGRRQYEAVHGWAEWAIEQISAQTTSRSSSSTAS